LLTPLLVARGLGRRYGERDVLSGVDLELAAGEVLGLIGPNGGGKSTLLLLMSGLVKPTSGTVSIDGVPCHQLAIAQSGAVGLITAEPGIYPLLTGRENLEFFGGLYGLSAADTEARARPLVDRLDLAGALDRRTAEWSSGMRQKLSLARALVMNPRVLLLDEPTANLDPIASRAIHEAIRAEADRGVAVVLATHDLPHAEAICDRVAVIAGRIRAVEAFGGPRAVAPPGRLHALYVSATGGAA
jgi:ABC-type multidrug transport system ATPase subunit